MVHRTRAKVAGLLGPFEMAVRAILGQQITVRSEHARGAAGCSIGGIQADVLAEADLGQAD